LWRVIDRGLSALWDAADDESKRNDQNAAESEGIDLFERLPEPAHLDPGAVTLGDGRLRFLD